MAGLWEWPLKADFQGVTVVRLCDVPRAAGDLKVSAGELDVAGLSWTSWDMIQKVRRADQAHSGTTDATRTERGLDAAGNEEMAGQWVFRWVGTGGL